MSKVNRADERSTLSLVPSLARDERAELQRALDAAERTIAQLEVGLAHRVIIGQAQGLLMERLGLDEERAFAYLKRASNESNRKLFDIAAQVTRTRNLPILAE